VISLFKVVNTIILYLIESILNEKKCLLLDQRELVFSLNITFLQVKNSSFKGSSGGDWRGIRHAFKILSLRS
jgi:hypothetical protein